MPHPATTESLNTGKHQYCRVVGRPVTVTLEHARDPERVDHVWITLDVAGAGHLRAVVNTTSLRNKAAGEDPRVRVGIVREPFDKLPEAGIFPADALDYATIESRTNVFYETCDQRAVELMVTEKADTAACVEVWGEVYSRHHHGIHQIHSRRASCAVTEDIIGRDGALKCYYPETKSAEMLLFKFCGQP